MKILYCSAGKVCLYISYVIFFYFLLCAWRPARGQTPYTIQGQVLAAENQEPLVGASVLLKGTTRGTSTDKNGYFSLTTDKNEMKLSLSFIGYRSLDTLLVLPVKKQVILTLHRDEALLEEVAVTGYQTIPKERATGSFVMIDQTLLNRKISTNILDRLDGVTSGIYFTGLSTKAASTNPLGRNLGIRIRGESSLADINQISRDPLIVLDNFPFEGNIDNINPNDVESVTVLRDAAAASIWGARAGNGVIVITTKKGKTNQPMQIELSANTTFTAKPNLNKDRNFISAADYIGVEQYLFDAGYFNSDLINTTNRPPVSPAVDILYRQRTRQLSAAEAAAELDVLRARDVRQDFARYVYRSPVSQQYAISLRGGAANASYIFSVGYDKNLTEKKRNDYNRITLRSLTTYRPVQSLELSVGIHYSSNSTAANNYENSYGYLSVGGKYGNLYPYARLADDLGTPLTVVKGYNPAYTAQAAAQGLLDWAYRPLEEIALADNTVRTQNLLLRGGIKYHLTPGLNAEIQYQNEREITVGRNYHNAMTYYARNLVNRFTLMDSAGNLTYQVPRGGTLELNHIDYHAHNLRGQLSLEKSSGRHGLSAVAGAEIRQLKTEGYQRTSYGYEKDLGISFNGLDYGKALPTIPSGSALIPYPDGNVSGVVNRFVSYFANAAYSYKSRYTISLSGRRDGANIFGAKTNDKITPLWSVGAGWDLSRETFFQNKSVPFLKLRVSYGFNGNAYQGSVYSAGTYSAAFLTGALAIVNLSAPNPQLRWERVRNINLGIDFILGKDMLSGSLEVYQKKGLDLIQNQELAPSTGFFSYNSNSASTRTTGLDVNLTSLNINRVFRWNTTLLLSLLTDKILRYDLKQSASTLSAGSSSPGVTGRPLYSIYSYRWAGLDAGTGDPQGYLNGEKSRDYSGMINNFHPDSLVYNGPGRPTFFGSLRNDFQYKRFSFSFNIVYKMGYYFRRPSVSLNYADILRGQSASDYALRWQQGADNSAAQVPSLVYPSNNSRNTFYRYSSVLVEKGDHIRLQDIRLGYELPAIKNLRVGPMQLFAYLSSLGILWRANQHGIDPDISSQVPTDHPLPAGFSLALGLKVNL